jgi:hypothetical protein
MAKTKESKLEETGNEEFSDPQVKNDMILIGAILGIIAIFGLIMFFVSTAQTPLDTVETRDFKGFTFQKHGDVWVTTLTVGDRDTGAKRDFEIYFHYFPTDVDHIPSMKNSRNETITPELFVNAKKVYITVDPDYPASTILGGVEIAKILAQVYGKEVKAAVTRTGTTDAEVVTCEDTREGVRIINLRLGNSTRIYSEKGCVVVQGTDTVELLKASERLTFEMLKML